MANHKSRVVGSAYVNSAYLLQASLFLLASSEYITPKTLCSGTGASRSTVQKFFKAMLDVGLFNRHARGKYTIAGEVKYWLSCHEAVCEDAHERRLNRI